MRLIQAACDIPEIEGLGIEASGGLGKSGVGEGWIGDRANLGRQNEWVELMQEWGVSERLLGDGSSKVDQECTFLLNRL